MNIETTFNLGDKAWVFTWNGEPTVTEVTIGQICVTVTNSLGSGDPDERFDNYKPQQGREEVYMCDETGIGSGTLYTLGEHIFRTREEAEAAWEKQLNEVAK